MTETSKHNLAVTASPEGEAKARALGDEALLKGSRLESDPNKSSYAGYLFGSSGSLDKPAWSDSMRGRLAIRVFSRGLVGGIFYTVGGHFASQQLKDYESFKPLEWSFTHIRRKPLQYVARGWDVVVGKPLEAMAHLLTPGDLEAKAHAAWEITNFRPKLFKPAMAAHADGYRDKWGIVHEVNGRGLGEELVLVTFDFFSMSIGDAFGRNFIQSFDPNLKQPWYLDENGHATTRAHGRFDFGRWAQSVGRASWRVITKNAGEDWAAALPYIYQMKWQRQGLAKAFPGFKLSSDNNMNGGLGLLDRNGHIVGGYQLPGIIDLQMRFMGYNWYTLMYREMYDALGRTYNRWRDNNFAIQMPKFEHPVEDTLGAPAFLARYVVKSLIKSGLYMFPAVPFFWITRTPQSKAYGAFAVDDLARSKTPSDESALVTRHPHAKAAGGHSPDHVFRENIMGDKLARAFLIHGPQERQATAYYGDGRTITTAHLPHTPFDWGVNRGVLDAVLNPFGWVCFQAGGGLTRAVDFILPHGDWLTSLMHKDSAGQALKGAEMLLAREQSLRTFANAAISYTPYMWAKAETALRVDDRRSVEQLGHMDKAIYRMIDNTFSFNFHGAKEAFGDVLYLAGHYEGDMKSREGAGAAGQSVGDGSVVPRATDRAEPHSKIHAGSIKRVPMQAGVADAAVDRKKPWAESVGRKQDGAAASVTPPTYH